MTEKRTATIVATKVICRQPGRYIGWPTIAKMPDGELLVVFSGDRDAHVDPFGKTFLVRSTDNGQTWHEPELINDTPLDDREPSICACQDGAVILTWCTSHYEEEAYLSGRCRNSDEELARRRKIQSVTETDIRQWAGGTVPKNGRYPLGHWLRRSTDRGSTWEEPIRIPVSTPHGPIVLSDGRLLLVATSGSFEDKQGDILVAESPDQGRTWSVISRVNMYPQSHSRNPCAHAFLAEPHVVELGPRRFLAMARYEEFPKQKERLKRHGSVLWQFTSGDGGNAWTEPRPTAIVGKPPHLIRLQDGRILVSYGYRRAPYGERACISADEGESWNYANEIILCDDAPSSDLGYPSSAQLDDGTIVTVYYQQERAGEKPCLMATLWRLTQ